MTAEEFDRTLLWRYRARMHRFVDADTLVAMVDTGYRGRHEVALRLYGVNAPEKWTEAGWAAENWLDNLLTEHGAWDTDDWQLRVETLQRETVVSEVTSFERWVSRVAVIDDDDHLLDIGDALVAAGHAERIQR